MKNILDRLKFKDLINKPGVYILQFKEYSYIGSSKNLYVRLKEHHNSLKKGSHYNLFLQRLYNKYGESAFKYDILEYCENYVERECFYIRTLSPKINVEQDPISQVKSQSTKDKISKALLGKLAGSKNPAARMLCQYSLSGDFIKEFSCATEAAKAVNGDDTSIGIAANGKSKSSAGYLWSRRKADKIKPLVIKSRNPYKYNQILEIDKNGNITFWKNINDLAKHLNVSIQAIHQSIKKNRPCKGLVIKLN